MRLSDNRGFTMILGLAVLAACASCSERAAWGTDPGQHAARLEKTLRINASTRFQLYLPDNFDASGHTRYPLMIFLHGSGESGTDLERVKVHGPPRLVAEGKRFPFILVSPQIPTPTGFEPRLLDALLDELLAQLPVDPDRVYLTGLSMGGIGTYAWASARPDRFAAIAPVCGEWLSVDACDLKRVPVWAFHGEKDEVVPIGADKMLIDKINACGGHARLTVYPDAGHDAWTETYSNPALYEWLLAQRRSRATGH